MTKDSSALDVSQITDYLYISAFPRKRNVDEVVSLGVSLILSMHWWRPNKALTKPPLRLLWLPTVDKPFLPMSMEKLNEGVTAALPVIEKGGAVLSHCKAGVHRSVAMASCVLIGMGYTADEAMQLIKEKRAVADPDAGYIQKRIRMFELLWQESGRSA